MQTNELTRREVLASAGALLSGLVISGARTAVAAAATSSSATKLPAAAAGRITIGKDMTVNRLGFGAMRVTGEGIWGDPPDVAEAKRVLRLAVELGVDFIDTADAYGPDVSERLIAEALHPYPKGLVIATKGGLVRPAPDKWERDGRPAHLREACRSQPASGCGSSASTSTSSTRSTRRFRWRNRSARSRSCRRKERSATSACRTSTSVSSSVPGRSCRSSRCRTATTCPTVLRTRYSPSANATASRSSRGRRCRRARVIRMPDPARPSKRGPRAQGLAAAGRHRLVAGAVARDAADTRYVEGEAPRGERGGCRTAHHARGDARDRLTAVTRDWHRAGNLEADGPGSRGPRRS